MNEIPVNLYWPAVTMHRRYGDKVVMVTILLLSEGVPLSIYYSTE